MYIRQSAESGCHVCFYVNHCSNLLACTNIIPHKPLSTIGERRISLSVDTESHSLRSIWSILWIYIRSYVGAFTEAAYMDGTQSMAADNIILDIIGGVIFIKVFRKAAFGHHFLEAGAYEAAPGSRMPGHIAEPP